MTSGASTILVTLERPVPQGDSSTVIMDSVGQFLSKILPILSPTQPTSQLLRHQFRINVNKLRL